jgi:hypothetical protein
VLAGCAGRAPQPVAVIQPQDRFTDCAAIAVEVQANNVKIHELAGEESEKVAQNLAAGVAGLFIWPLLFGMDFQGAASTETSALQSRQEYLGTLASQKSCGASGAGVAEYPPASVGAPAPAATPMPAAALLPAPAGAAPAPSPPVAQTTMASASPQPALPAGALTPGHAVLFPVTIQNRYYPPSTYVNVQ